MRNLNVIIGFIVILAFVGCYTPHFLPNTAPTPMFDKQGNIRIAGYAGTNSYDVNIGISPIEHIGIIAAGSYSASKKVDNEENNKKPDSEAKFTHGHRYYEGAIGYYFSPFRIGDEEMKIEIFAGYGKGTANGSIDSDKKNIFGFIIPIDRVDADYKQYYLQLNAAIFKKSVTESSESILEYGSIFRLSKTDYSNFRKFGQAINIPSMESNFLQLGIFGNTRSGALGLTAQTGWLMPLTEDKSRPSYSPFFITAGLRIDLW